MKKDTYCVQPFREIAMKNFDGDQLVTFWPCCMMANQISTDRDINVLGIENAQDLTPQEMYDHPRMQLLRENLLNGVRDSACEVCWHQEDRGLKSFRQWNNENPNYQQTDGLSNIDISASNICNLRCRMCTPSNSHQLMIDNDYFEKNGLSDNVKAVTRRWGILENVYKTTDSKQWDWLFENTHQIKYLKASGGEPFYDKKIVRLLNQYVKVGTAKDTILDFHTNATLFTHELVDILNEFKLNDHTFSIDGVGKTYEYIRYPATFEQLENSVHLYLRKVKNYKKIVQFTIVVTAHNLLILDEYIKWTRSLPAEVSIQFSEVYDPDRGIAIKHLPVHLLELAKQKLKDNTYRSGIDVPDENILNLINFVDIAIKNNKQNKFLVRRESQLFDMSRNQSYRDFLHKDLVKWLDS